MSKKPLIIQALEFGDDNECMQLLLGNTDVVNDHRLVRSLQRNPPGTTSIAYTGNCLYLPGNYK